MTFELNILVIDEKINMKTIEECEGFYHFGVISWRLYLSEYAFIIGIGCCFSMCF